MHKSRLLAIALSFACIVTSFYPFDLGSLLAQEATPVDATTPVDREKLAAQEAQFITQTRPLTFDGLRSGEGYFSADARKMVFQTERDPANPFYQIYLMDLENGDMQRVSTGTGKTTCAWIHPDGDQILYASTEADPESANLQQAELAFRASGQKRRYAFDYDKHFDLYVVSQSTGQKQRLTTELGYDAEGSFSPDGKTILFASNRSAYDHELSEREQTLFDHDPASMCDIYRINADGTGLKKLTDTIGYDGGPFFSPDGNRFCYRHFTDDGLIAEIHTMGIDGSEPRQLTKLNAMSWAPFYHPSGKYLIFTTNINGFANFELYLVRTDGQGEPVRVTFTEGFDGLPVFLPDGNQISWTSTRGSIGAGGQIYLAQWNHAAALKALALDAPENNPFEAADRSVALSSAKTTSPSFTAADVGRHVDYLTRPELGGRLTGTEGERRATSYVAAYLDSLGFEPAGENGTYFQSFEFPAGSELTGENNLSATMDDKTQACKLNEQYRPLSFSGSGKFDAAPIVFAGYGLVTPALDKIPEYDSYVHLDVTDKWVLVFRDLPQDISPEMRQHWARYSSPRRKATTARDLGARGIIFVAGPTSKVQQQLIRFDRDASEAGVSMAVLSVSDELAAQWLDAAEKSLADEQKSLDSGEMAMGYELPKVKVSASVEITRHTGTGRNVLARLRCTDPKSTPVQPVVMVGAHIDHLGVGGAGSSLARDEERDQVHVGADDNASGVAAMLEICQYLATEQRHGRLQAKRDLLVAAWSGEELGLFGSQAFVKAFYELYPSAPKRVMSEEERKASEAHQAMLVAHGAAPEDEPLTAAIAAYLNLDMVGRLREKLVIQGTGSSPGWEAEIQRRNVPVGLALQLDKTASACLPMLRHWWHARFRFWPRSRELTRIITHHAIHRRS